MAISVVQDADGNNKYAINGEIQETFELTEGLTYIFDQSDASNSGYNLLLSTTEDGVHGDGIAYNEDVSIIGVPGESGAITTIKVSGDTPNLNIYCSLHSGMGCTLTSVPFQLKDIKFNIIDSIANPNLALDVTAPKLSSIKVESQQRQLEKNLKFSILHLMIYRD